MSYEEFLRRKRLVAPAFGIDVRGDEINPKLFPFQRDITLWALQRGRAAIFAECGLGKTLMQVEWAKHVAAHTGGRVLLVAPLAVAHQTIAEAQKINVDVVYRRHQEQVADERLVITNYEMVKEFDPGEFVGVVLDESSILKAFTGTTKRMLIDMFAQTPFRLACTATPAPNDHLELGNHSQFLGVMDSDAMISRWFINDTMAAGQYRLKKHAERDFWRWVTSWAVCLSKPSDLGPEYSDERFVLPELRIHEHPVAVDHARALKKGQLFLTEAQSATSMWAEKRATLVDRCRAAREIVGDSDDYWILWCDTNDEADELKRLFPDAVEVRGSDTLAAKEEKLTAFSRGEVKKIITKPDIAGFGLNWQHCSKQIFVGVTYSFEKTYQALRRSWRFGQAEPVDAYLIYAETEGNIREKLAEKQRAHAEMQRAMNEAMREYGLGLHETAEALTVRTDVADGDGWQLLLGDCVQRIREIPDQAADFCIFSPPFSTLYIYSDMPEDMGNCADDNEFFEHFGYLIPELFRVTKAGRLCAVHCKDLPKYKNRDGAAGLRDFPGEIIRAFEAAGWTYHSRVTIWRDPVTEMQRTKNHGLLWKNFTIRGEVCRQGMPDYLVVFRKWTEDMPDKQVRNAPRPGEYIGTNPPVSWQDERDYSIQVWQKYASPVWFDINPMNVLNVELAREDKDEKHICPLQLDVIARCIEIWTNPGDLVFSPFAGIGSEGYQALLMGRRFLGIELKEQYWRTAIGYLRQAEMQSKQQTLFDAVGQQPNGRRYCGQG